MAKLYIVNHLKDNVGDLAVITQVDQNLIADTDYKVSPIEVGFDYVYSLFNKFDEVLFDTAHDNYPVLVLQTELETLYQNNIAKQVKTVLDKNVLNFFGCSHTYGTGHLTKSTTYPSVLSSLLGLEYSNYGLPGRGNYDIEDLLTGYSVKDTKLIIQFTDIYRIRYLDKGRLIQDGIYRIDHSHPVLFSEENLFFNFKYIVDRIVTRLRDGNNQFLITYTHNIDNEWAIKANSFLHGFNEYSSAMGTQIDTANDGAHYGILSHRLWAERLYTKWMKLYG